MERLRQERSATGPVVLDQKKVDSIQGSNYLKQAKLKAPEQLQQFLDVVINMLTDRSCAAGALFLLICLGGRVGVVEVCPEDDVVVVLFL